ncbi:Leucine carboxyl methyltransferase 2 [Fusarium acutatum]|uniref:tRNA wybutosine-synthesizing protein 4 n=1 Tax=Fusarium acutatum TaxID=78861 RepID=A0A8H4JB72_9HYPO|nr:Leucine carboxyl methyltransferase 2 [Fusarium acutatum]
MAKGTPPSTKMTRTQALDDLIMGTNSSSIVSKRSVERLYYPDELHFFRYFVSKFQRRAPLINRGYWLRLRAIDVIVRQFVTSLKPGRKKVVINLGAGSDVLPWQSYYRYGDSCENTLFIDVDYPDLMLKKRAIVLGTPQLHELLGDSPAISEKVTDQILLRSDKYCQIGCDLRELESLRNCLESFLNLTECSVLFVAEVSITYMDTFSADALVQWASSIGQESQRRRFQERGWSSVDAWDLWEVWNSDLFLDSTERAALDDVEPFDEWEEFVLFSRHYVVLHAAAYHRDERGAGQCGQVGQVGVSNKYVKANVTSLGSLGAPKRRFGAPLIACSPEGDKYLINALGMGIKARLDSCDIYSLQQDSIALEISPAGPTARLCHATVDIGHLGTLLIGGRASPSKALNDCWIFKKDSNRWEKTFDLPTPLFRHCAVHLPGSSLALVLGGKTGPSEISPDYYVFHPVKGWLKCSVTGAKPSSTFGTLAVASPSPRSKYSTFQGLMAGGISKYGKINEQAYFWTINVSTDVPHIHFEIVTDSHGYARSLSVFGAQTAGVESLHFVCGGVGQDPSSQGQSMTCISVKDGHLEAFNVDLRNDAGRLPFMVGSATVSSGSELVVLGGGATCFSMGTFWDTGVYKIDLTNPLSEMPHIQPATCSPASVNYQDSPKLTHQTTTIDWHQPTLKPSIKSIARIKLQSKLDFEQLVENRRPVIIESLDLGGCVDKWSPEYMVQRVGQMKEIVVHECQSSTGKMDFNSKNFRYVTEPFSAFMAKAARGEAVYLRALSEAKPTESPANLQDDFPTLADDFQLPEELSLIKDRMFSSVLRISGRAKMWLHYDVMANVYTQIQGSKRMVLLPPTDVNNLAFAPGASSSSLDVLAALDKQELVSTTNPYEAILNPGDLLYIPAMWLHTASPTTDLSVAVNVFFRDLDSGYSTGRDVYGNRDLAAYEKARQDISRIVKSFDRLPSEIRDFYLKRLADELLHKQN